MLVPYECPTKGVTMSDQPPGGGPLEPQTANIIAGLLLVVFVVVIIIAAVGG